MSLEEILTTAIARLSSAASKNEAEVTIAVIEPVLRALTRERTRQAIPEAWSALLNEPDELLRDLLAEGSDSRMAGVG